MFDRVLNTSLVLWGYVLVIGPTNSQSRVSKGSGFDRTRARRVPTPYRIRVITTVSVVALVKIFR